MREPNPYIHDLTLQVKKHLTSYLRMIGHNVDHQGYFHCVFPENHANADRDPSAHINTKGDGTEVWYCQVCNQGGTIIDMASELEGLPITGIGFIHTVISLAKRLGIPYQLDMIPEIDKEVLEKEERLETIYKDIDHYLGEHGKGNDALTNGRFGRNYTDEQAVQITNILPIGSVDAKKLTDHMRGIHGKSIEETPLYDKDKGLLGPYIFGLNRLSFAIRNKAGVTVAYGCRISKEEEANSSMSKYMYSPGFQRNACLFLLDCTHKEIRRKRNSFIVEGPFDVLTSYVNGITSVVGLLSNNVSANTVETLMTCGAESITSIPDGDQGGVEAVMKLVETARDYNLPTYACQTPQGEDPDSYISKVGAAMVVNDRVDGVEYVLSNYAPFHTSNVSNDERYTRMVKFVANVAAIKAKKSLYADVIGQYHPYTKDGIIEDINNHSDVYTMRSRKEQRIWDKIAKSKDKNTSEKMMVLEESMSDIKDLMRTDNDGIHQNTWLNFMAIYEGKKKISTVLKTGFDYLDSLCSIETGALTFISGWPSHGKSSLMRFIAYQMTLHNENVHCLYVSTDDPPEAVMVNLMSMVTRVQKEKIKTAVREKSLDEIDELKQHMDEFRNIFQEHMTIIGLEECRSTAQTRQRIEQLKVVHPDKTIVVVVDAMNNLQDIETDDQRIGIENAIRKFKTMAVINDVALIVVSHLTKSDGRLNTRPKLSNLKGTSFIEYEAKTIMMVHMDMHVNESSNLSWFDRGEKKPVIELYMYKDKDHEANKLDPLEFDPLINHFNETSKDIRDKYCALVQQSKSGISGDSGGDDGLAQQQDW